MFLLYRLDGLESPLIASYGSKSGLTGLVSFLCPPRGEKKLLLKQENLDSV